MSKFAPQYILFLKTLAIIPARYASTRFPGKPLVDINGVTMIERVYRQASKAKTLEKIVVATDDQRIFDHCTSFGAPVLMTSSNHLTGTDRCGEAYSLVKETYDIVLNIQGDEPFVQPEQIDLLINFFVEHFDRFDVSTLSKRITSYKELFDSNTVKLVTDVQDKALYFSRSTIPHLRGIAENLWLDHSDFFKHIGLYAYKANILNNLAALKSTSLEKSESLEQLRWLQNSLSIGVIETTIETISIDTPEDLKEILKSDF